MISTAVKNRVELIISTVEYNEEVEEQNENEDFEE